jgi:hypothetical protein
MPMLLDLFRPPPTNDVLPLHTLVINLDRRKDRWEGPASHNIFHEKQNLHQLAFIIEYMRILSINMIYII